MRFIQEFGFNVKRGQDEAFQTWLIDNEEALANAHPAGSKYIGTFAVVFSSEKQAGEYRSFVQLDSYGAMDTAAAASRDPNSPIGKLLREMTKFFDANPTGPWSNGLFKAVVDTTLWNVE
jgi:hypothetical protein